MYDKISTARCFNKVFYLTAILPRDGLQRYVQGRVDCHDKDLCSEVSVALKLEWTYEKRWKNGITSYASFSASPRHQLEYLIHLLVGGKAINYMCTWLCILSLMFWWHFVLTCLYQSLNQFLTICPGWIFNFEDIFRRNHYLTSISRFPLETLKVRSKVISRGH